MARSAHANIDRKGRRTREHELIRIRVSAEAKVILQRAAALRGQRLSEFMIDSARRQAEEVILDQRILFLDAKAHEKLLELLDAPVKLSAELRARVKRTPIWEIESHCSKAWPTILQNMCKAGPRHRPQR